MTVSLTLKVNGNYRATAKHNVEGRETEYQVGPNEEKSISFTHGVENVLTITEEAVTDRGGEAERRPTPDQEPAQAD